MVVEQQLQKAEVGPPLTEHAGTKRWLARGWVEEEVFFPSTLTRKRHKTPVRCNAPLNAATDGNNHTFIEHACFRILQGFT